MSQGTKYVPVHADGRRGPAFDTMTAASLYAIGSPGSGWRVELEFANEAEMEAHADSAADRICVEDGE